MRCGDWGHPTVWVGTQLQSLLRDSAPKCPCCPSAPKCPRCPSTAKCPRCPRAPKCPRCPSSPKCPHCQSALQCPLLAGPLQCLLLASPLQCPLLPRAHQSPSFRAPTRTHSSRGSPRRCGLPQYIFLGGGYMSMAIVANGDPWAAKAARAPCFRNKGINPLFRAPAPPPRWICYGAEHAYWEGG